MTNLEDILPQYHHSVQHLIIASAADPVMLPAQFHHLKIQYNSKNLKKRSIGLYGFIIITVTDFQYASF